MVLLEAIEAAVGLAFGHVEQLGLALTMVFTAHYLSKGMLLAAVFQNIRVVLIVLAVLAVTPAVSIHPGAAIAFVMGLVRAAVGVFPF